MGLMICIEGLDAIGKNTQAKKLAEKLDSFGRAAVIMSFPRYETTVGKAIRRHLVGELFVGEVQSAGGYALADEDPLFFQALMLADKTDAAHEINHKLVTGSIVICDRWIPSAICFGEADGLDAVWLRHIHEYLPQPDINILIDVPEEEALRRRPQLRDRYEKDREKQAAVRANYDVLWKAMMEDNDGSWVRVDGVGTVDEVAARIWEHVTEWV